jgi:hypothetical protein
MMRPPSIPPRNAHRPAPVLDSTRPVYTRWRTAAIEVVGHQLLERLRTTVADLKLDDRSSPLTQTGEEEEDLARLLLGAAWYALNYRNPLAFPLTPLCKAAFADPSGFTLATLLALPHRDLVDDLVAQVHAADNGPLG